MDRPIVSMFDESGNMLEPWAEAGWTCYAYDLLNSQLWPRVKHFPSGGKIVWRHGDLNDASTLREIAELNPAIVFGFPPCTDLASSGARHFDDKWRKNPEVFNEALKLCLRVPEIGGKVGCPWMFENPVGLITNMWRKWNFKFSPHEYGGYLPEDDVHPRWPQYIVGRDAYPKQTCIWSGNGFIEPPRKPVEVKPGYSQQYYKLGGKSLKTKMIRSETPRGFAKAVFEANSVKIFAKDA